MNHFGCILEGPVDAFLRTERRLERRLERRVERRLERRLVAWGAGALKTPQDPPQYPPATSQRRPRDPPRPSRPPPRRFQNRHNTAPRCPKIPQTPPDPCKTPQDAPRQSKTLQKGLQDVPRGFKGPQKTRGNISQWEGVGGGVNPSPEG